MRSPRPNPDSRTPKSMNARATRRGVVAGVLSLPVAASLYGFGLDGPRSATERGARSDALGPPQPFSFDLLLQRARRLAREPYRVPAVRFPEILARIGYDEHQHIVLKREHALRAGEVPVAIDLFHLANLFREPVAIHLVQHGVAREARYARRLFTFGEPAAFAAALPDDLGFAGFRVRHPDTWKEWLAFLGASYFRSPGELGEYGISARGIAVNTATQGGEEFPRFSAFWLEPRPEQRETLVVHALLEGPSLTGAYRMTSVRETGVVMDVEARLFPRRDIERLGLAPLTSMFWYGEHNRHQARDWRPEVHDSDGLALWTGAGEHIWRPLNNPPLVQVSAFLDNDPKGFGLMQRDRDFDNYQDANVYYDRRPSLWVEPLAPWGRGAVHLVELPTDGEFNDNIVAYWHPEQPVTAGQELSLSYRLHWRAEEPFASPLARVVATRLGSAGVRDPRAKKVVVDFEGGRLGALDRALAPSVEFAVSAPRGKIERVHTLPIGDTRRWRAVFEYAAADAAPVDLRGHLRLAGAPLSETWIFQFIAFG